MSGWQKTLPWTAGLLALLWPEGPARRKRWVKLAAAILAVLAVHAGLTAVAAARHAKEAARFVERWGPMDPTHHRPPEVQDAANKARVVRAAAELMTLPAPGARAGTRLHEEFASKDESRLPGPDREAIRGVVESNRVALSLLDAAAERAGSNWGLHYEWGHQMDVPPLLRILQLAKLNAASGRLALEEGRVDEAVGAVRRGSAIATALDREPVLIVQMVRLAVARLNALQTRRILRSARLSTAQAESLRAALKGPGPRETIREAMVVEAKAIAPALVEMSQAPAAGPHKTGIGPLMTVGIVRVAAGPYLLEEGRLWLALMSHRIGRFDAPRHGRPAADPGPRLRSWNVLVRIAATNDAGILERADLAEARDRIALTALAIESHRIESGRTPDTLEALVARLPGRETIIDPLTGLPFRYETDGSRWRVASEADTEALETAESQDPLLDWSSPAAEAP